MLWRNILKVDDNQVPECEQGCLNYKQFQILNEKASNTWGKFYLVDKQTEEKERTAAIESQKPIQRGS